MNPLTHVYYDKANNQIVLFESTLDSKYTFIFEDGQVMDLDFKDLDTFEDRIYYDYVGSLTE